MHPVVGFLHDALLLTVLQFPIGALLAAMLPHPRWKMERDILAVAASLAIAQDAGFLFLNRL